MQALASIEPIRRTEEKSIASMIIKPYWWDQSLPSNYNGMCKQVVRSFLQGTMTEKVVIKNNNFEHVYVVKNDGTELWMHKNNKSIQASVCVIKKLNGLAVGNASSLIFSKNIKTGQVKPVRSHRLLIQQVMQDVLPMVPFGLFEDSKLDLNSMHIIEKGPDEMLEEILDFRKKPTHYTGALVFKIKSTKGNDEFFLFDIDRNDLKLKNINFFLSKLSRPVTGLEDAYDSLKPQEVSDAERFIGPCPRQGEWFFIPVPGRFKRKKELGRWGRGRPAFVQAVLQSKGNRPHHVKFLSEEGYVTGKVSHGGHEHKPIELKGWHRAVPNTAVESFKISGAVD